MSFYAPGRLSNPPLTIALAQRDAVYSGAPAMGGTPAGLRTDVAGRVLYIDDDDMNRVLMQAFFTLRPRVQLSLAVNGRDGVQAAQEGRFQLIMIDMMLPDINGSEVLQALRRHEASHHTPCIAVSANAMPEEIADALAAGFDGYLTKPLSAPALLAEIDRHL
jgi:CheY-like chemotaxis protein